MRYKALFFLIFMLLFATSVMGVRTCINETDVCYDIDSNVFRQDINLWEGQNQKYGLNIINPEDELDQSWYKSAWNSIVNFFSTNKIDITDLEDETTFEFQSHTDFYNFLQQQNALGNVSLFTTAELNKITREKTILLTGEIIDWTFILILVILETFKMVIAVGLIILSIYAFFRVLPAVLNIMKKIVFSIMTGKKIKVIKK
jgi:hypothetical protein